MCDKCNDIASRNFRVDPVTRDQVVCFSCAHRRGSKIGLVTPPKCYNLQANADSNSGLAVIANSIPETCKDKLRDEGILPYSSDTPTFYDESNPSLVLATANQEPPQQKPRHQQLLHQNSTPASHSQCSFLEAFSTYLTTI